jgi:hypothetical protein
MNDNELEHIGVLGMKWGHRKSEISSINTRTDKFILKKGTIINRASTRDNEKNVGRTYATFKKWDAVGYMARSLPFQKTFNMRMKLTEDLVSPSKKERIDAFIDLMKKDKTFSKNLAEAQHKMVKFKTAEAFEKQYKKMSEAQLRAKAYNDLSLELGFDETVRKKYFNELKKRGYNMVLDDTDAQALSNSPIIIFDRAKSLRVASVDRVTLNYLKDFIKENTK